MLKHRLLMSALLIPATIGLFVWDHQLGPKAPILFVIVLAISARCVWEEISGMFSYWGVVLGIRDVTDGTSNTIMVGEVRPDCFTVAHRTWGWWFSNSNGNAHASTVTPINETTTCQNAPKRITNPACTDPVNYNYSWGFKSFHIGGAQFLWVDGSVRFVSQNIDHAVTFQRLGGRADGQVVGDF